MKKDKIWSLSKSTKRLRMVNMMEIYEGHVMLDLY